MSEPADKRSPSAESAAAESTSEPSVMGHVLAIGQDDFDAAHGIDSGWLHGDRQPHDFVPPLAEQLTAIALDDVEESAFCFAGIGSCGRGWCDHS